MKLKYACVDGGQYGLNVSPDEYRGDGLRLIRTSDLGSDWLAPGNGVSVDAPVDERFILQADDILVSRAGTIGRTLLVTPQVVGSTFAGFLVRFRPGAAAIPRYLNYALQSGQVQHTILSEAISSTIRNFNADRYANLDIPEHGTEEQQRIADFLDDRTTRIDKIILARRHQLRSAVQSLASVISEVTAPRGSGQLIKFARVARLNDGLVDPLEEPFASMPLIAPDHIAKATGELLALSSAQAQGAVSGKGHVQCGQIIYSKIRPSLRKAVIAPVEALCSADAYAMTANSALMRTDFLLLTLLGDYFTQQVVEASERVAMPKVNRDSLAEVRVLVPDLPSQEKAARSVDRYRADLRSVSLVLQQSIDLLTEYKTSLITAAVSGEIDVTTAGSGIPG